MTFSKAKMYIEKIKAPVVIYHRKTMIPSSSKTLPSIEEVKRKIVPVLQRHQIKRAALFGSVVRGEIREDSDIDILVEVNKSLSLLDFIGIKQEIEDTLERRVDLVEYDAIKPMIRNTILKEQVMIL
ncbi:MAG: nucleotidyltransferase family protein [bacterium]